MKIYLIAPSGATLDQRGPDLGIRYLREQGVTVENFVCVKRVHQRFAGTDLERLAEINSLAQLEAETIVMATRGGYGLQRILGGIEWSALADAVKQGVQICGHSDFTALQLGLLAKTGAISLAGPMLNYDFGGANQSGDTSAPNSFMWQHFQRAINERRLDCEVQNAQSYLGAWQSTKALNGLLWGGNLTILCTLIGSEFMPSIEQTRGGILFLEDINEHPYRLERMLIQLFEAGFLAQQKAILLGDFSGYRLADNDRGYDLANAIAWLRERLPSSIPILTGLPFGHCPEKLTLPVGAQANLTANLQGFTLQAQW